MSSTLTAANRQPPRSLRILPEEGPLRQSAPYATPTDFPPDEQNETPRALRALSRIVQGGLCHRCGSCTGICPTKVLALDEEEYPRVENLSACTDCNLCVQVCPGDEFPLNEVHQEVFGSDWDPLNTHGTFREAFISYSTDPDIRERSTSGGLVTGILLDLLEKGEIDGALVIASDEHTLWKGRPIVARTRDEILGAMKSKYAISPTNVLFQQVLEIPGKYALVGLPCQIHGYHKAAALDGRLKERITCTIGLYCHAAVEHEAFRIIWSGLGDHTEGATKFISRIGKHPGAPHIKKKDGSLYPVYYGNKKGYRPSSMELINIIYRLYTPDRCMTCFDASAEFADIVVGDPWMAPPEDNVNFYDGWSFGLTRTERGEAICKAAEKSGSIVVQPVSQRQAMACNKIMSTEKRWRAYRVIETHRRQGKPIPVYGEYPFDMPHQSGKQFVKTELHIFSHIFCYLPKYRAAVLRFMLSGGGYSLLWLNNKRRALRFWFRDTIEKYRRKFFKE